MTRQFGILGVAAFALGVVAAGIASRGPAPATAAEPAERGFDEGAAIKIMMKNQNFDYLDRPRVERIGGRAFVVGRRVVNAEAWAWLPVDDAAHLAAHLEVYVSLDTMLRTYPGLAKKN